LKVAIWRKATAPIGNDDLAEQQQTVGDLGLQTGLPAPVLDRLQNKRMASTYFALLVRIARWNISARLRNAWMVSAPFRSKEPVFTMSTAYSVDGGSGRRL
jgi:hypothetical protein